MRKHTDHLNDKIAVLHEAIIIELKDQDVVHLLVTIISLGADEVAVAKEVTPLDADLEVHL